MTVKTFLLKTISGYKYISRVFREARLPFFVYTDCRYYPSCSDYAIEAVNKHGVIRGSAKSLLRILRCSPFSKGGVDAP